MASSLPENYYLMDWGDSKRKGMFLRILTAQFYSEM